VKDARQNTTQYQYDTLNRQIAVIYPDQSTSTTAYDALGRAISKTDQAGKVTAYGYDALGRLTSVTQDAVTGGLNLLTQYGYDEVGNRISQTDANGHSTTYSYDQLGRRVGRSLPAGQSESYIYDSAGNLKSKTDFNGKTTAYAYDSSNRLLSKTPDLSFNAPTVSFSYFPNGLRQTMSDVSGTTTYGYDTRDRLTSKQTPFGTLSYTYDAAGDLLTLASSNTNGASLTYTYDTLNRLSTVTDNRLLAQGAASGLTTYNYDVVGNLQNFVYPNGVTHAYTYDTLNRLTQMGSSKNALAISNYAYTLGAAGNRTSVAELSGRSVAYAYDSLYRLTSETVTSDPAGKNGAIGYTYDAVGNRLTLNSTLPPTGATNYGYDADDRLASDQYDSNGNTILSGGVSDVYDFENHLIHKGGVTIVYDGDGNRVSETAGTVTTNYLVDTQNPTGYAQVVDELQNGLVARSYSYGLERINENQTLNAVVTASFYGYDGHGSVRQLFDISGTTTDRYDYDAFGNLINSSGSTPNLYLLAGERYDPALGLYDGRARYFNTTTGRFWSMDTDEGNDEDPRSLHKYLYVGDSPIDYADPSGFGILPSVLESILVGKEVHRKLYKDFLSKVPGGFANRAIATILNLPMWRRLLNPIVHTRPDLADPTFMGNPRIGQVYEIKPLLEISLGVTQLLGYLGTLNTQDPQGRYWIPGMTYEPQNPVKLDDGRTVTVNPPAFGLITYELDDNSGSNGFNTSMVQSAVWAGMLLTVGLAIVTSLLAGGPAGALA
jgi:RHS repeat-associated protein